MLAFPATNQIRTLATCAFNYAVWYIRTHLLATLDLAMPEGEVCNKIVALACSTIPADNTTNRGELATKALANAPPEDMLACYTDGSALGSPGPCGGGFVIVRKGNSLRGVSISLGIGDNNLGEMGAILGLLEALLQMQKDGSIPEGRILIFSDSACCVGYLERGWNCPTILETARKTRAALAKLRGMKPVSVYWIRGHSEVRWNEVADELARKGAEAAQRLELHPPSSESRNRGLRRKAPG
jgi:ribonuclease HI